MEHLGAQMDKEEGCALQAVQMEHGIQGEGFHSVTAIQARPLVQRSSSAQPPEEPKIRSGDDHVLATPPLTEMPRPPMTPKPQQGLRPRFKIRNLPAGSPVPKQKFETTQSTGDSTGDVHGTCSLRSRPTHCSSQTSLDEAMQVSRVGDLLID